MPIDYRRYPADWKQISEFIRHTRAAGRCEWSDGERCEALNYRPHPVTGSRVILTVAHVCECVPKCGDPAHLYALCQMHHLRLDLAHHIRNAARTRRRRKIEAGQLEITELMP